MVYPALLPLMRTPRLPVVDWTDAPTDYPALLKLMRTPRLPAVDWTDAPADLNGLVRFGERRNLVSARVPSRFKRSLSPLYSPVTNYFPAYEGESEAWSFYTTTENTLEKHHILESAFFNN